jgi:hypothetical protein
VGAVDQEGLRVNMELVPAMGSRHKACWKHGQQRQGLQHGQQRQGLQLMADVTWEPCINKSALLPDLMPMTVALACGDAGCIGSYHGCAFFKHKVRALGPTLASSQLHASSCKHVFLCVPHPCCWRCVMGTILFLLQAWHNQLVSHVGRALKTLDCFNMVHAEAQTHNSD